MPAPDFHNYARRLATAARRADPTATEAQREAGNARIGRVFMHGLEIAVEYPRGSIRRGIGADGKPWARAINGAGYGYINCTKTASDGEQLDVWLGDHPASQLGFLVSMLTPEGEFDEYKACLGVLNHAEAKKLITSNYPTGWWDTRVGEVRGFFIPDLKKHLHSLGVMKPRRRTKSSSVDWSRLLRLIRP